jgi:hypothetical protein
VLVASPGSEVGSDSPSLFRLIAKPMKPATTRMAPPIISQCGKPKYAIVVSLRGKQCNERGASGGFSCLPVTLAGLFVIANSNGPGRCDSRGRQFLPVLSTDPPGARIDSQQCRRFLIFADAAIGGSETEPTMRTSCGSISPLLAWNHILDQPGILPGFS